MFGLLPLLARGVGYLAPLIKSAFNPANIVKIASKAADIAGKVGKAAAVASSAIELAKQLPEGVGARVDEFVNKNPGIRKGISVAKDLSAKVGGTAQNVIARQGVLF